VRPLVVSGTLPPEGMNIYYDTQENTFTVTYLVDNVAQMLDFELSTRYSVSASRLPMAFIVFLHGLLRKTGHIIFDCAILCINR
jgi:hypothetical protein